MNLEFQNIEYRKRACIVSYHQFFREFWGSIEPEKLTENWHVEYLCDELQEIAERVFSIDVDGNFKPREPLKVNEIINISPGETKSTICTIMYPVWCWIRDPSLRIITCSYSRELSIYHAVKSRDLIRSTKFQRWFGDVFQLRLDMDAKSHYGNNMGGQRITASVGSNVTGKHAHIIIMDDPQSPQQAHSDVERVSTNTWLERTLTSRKVSQEMTPSILIMQRLHEEDATNLFSKKWEKSNSLKWVRLPADDRYKIRPKYLEKFYTKDGDRLVMNPGRKNTKVIKMMEADMTLAEAGGQLGQDPQPAEGNILKKTWFTNRFLVHALEEEAKTLRSSIVWNAVLDGAYTKITNNSATGILVYTIWNRRLYWRNYQQFFLEFPELCEEVPKFLERNGFTYNSTLFVEPKAIGKSLVQTLQRVGGLNIIEDPLPDGITRQEGKDLRVINSAPYFRGMNTYLNGLVEWGTMINQLAVFPNGKHNDLVDCATMTAEKVGSSHSIDKWMEMIKEMQDQ